MPDTEIAQEREAKCSTNKTQIALTEDIARGCYLKYEMLQQVKQNADRQIQKNLRQILRIIKTLCYPRPGEPMKRQNSRTKTMDGIYDYCAGVNDTTKDQCITEKQKRTREIR